MSHYMQQQSGSHHKPFNESSVFPGSTISSSPVPKRHAPNIPLPQAPGAPPSQVSNTSKPTTVVNDDDDDFVYEEMKSFQIPVPKPSPTPRRHVKEDDYEGMDRTGSLTGLVLDP